MKAEILASLLQFSFGWESGNLATNYLVKVAVIGGPLTFTLFHGRTNVNRRWQLSLKSVVCYLLIHKAAAATSDWGLDVLLIDFWSVFSDCFLVWIIWQLNERISLQGVFDPVSEVSRCASCSSGDFVRGNTAGCRRMLKIIGVCLEALAMLTLVAMCLFSSPRPACRCQERGLNLRLEKRSCEIPESARLAPWNRIWEGPKQWSEREEEQLPSPLRGFGNPLLTLLTYSVWAHVHARTREGEEDRVRGSKGKEKNGIERRNSVVSETVTWACVPHQLLQLSNPAKAFSRCLLPTYAHVCEYMAMTHMCWLPAHTQSVGYSLQMTRQAGEAGVWWRGEGWEKNKWAWLLTRLSRRWLIFRPLLSRPAATRTLSNTHSYQQLNALKIGLSSIICLSLRITWSLPICITGCGFARSAEGKRRN